MSTTYKIAEVAERSGFPSSTLRYWEDIGLLPPAARTGAGYRTYDDGDLDRLAFIARAKLLGCTLEETGGLVTTWNDEECGPVKHRLRALVDAKLADAHSRIADLTAFTAQLRQAAAQLAARPPDGPCDDDCGCTSSPNTGPVQAVRLTAGPPSTDGPPIACTLTGADMAGRLDQWQAVLDGVVQRDQLPDGLRLTFAPGSDIAVIARLAGAEQGCCAFFRFALTVDHRGTALEVRAPADVLTSLFGAAA